MNARGPRAGLALLTAVLTACASTVSDSDLDALLRSSPWQRADIRGITLYSNLPAEKTRRTVERLSRFLDLIAKLAPGGRLDLDRPAEVFLFARVGEWSLFDAERLGHALDRPSGYRVGLSADENTYDVLFHELVHVALYTRRGVEYPRWYHEGLAEVLSSAVIREDLAVVGSLAVQRRHTLARFEPLPLDEILSDRAVDSDELRSRFYADAFAFVHFGLLSEEQPRRASEFNAFVARTRDGAPWREALSRSFSADLASVESAFRAHRSSLLDGVSRPVLIELPGGVPSFEVVPVAEPEMARVLATYAASAELDPAFVGGLEARAR